MPARLLLPPATDGVPCGAAGIATEFMDTSEEPHPGVVIHLSGAGTQKYMYGVSLGAGWPMGPHALRPCPGTALRPRA